MIDSSSNSQPPPLELIDPDDPPPQEIQVTIFEFTGTLHEIF